MTKRAVAAGNAAQPEAKAEAGADFDSGCIETGPRELSAMLAKTPTPSKRSHDD
jgi:hypothetical protein